MGNKLLVSVHLAGENLEMFKILKKHFYLSSDAELMRMCLRSFYDGWLKEQEKLEHYEQLKKELGDELEKQVSKSNPE
jgi:hypothetical protein